jgi:hypothetical protein
MVRVIKNTKVTLLVDQISIFRRWVDEMIDGAACTTFYLLKVMIYSAFHNQNDTMSTFYEADLTMPMATVAYRLVLLTAGNSMQRNLDTGDLGE